MFSFILLVTYTLELQNLYILQCLCVVLLVNEYGDLLVLTHIASTSLTPFILPNMYQI